MQHLTKHPADKYRGGLMRATACIVACSPTTASVFLFAARARKLSLSASLEWAEKTIERHPRDNDDAAAIQILEFFLCLGSISCFPSRFADRAGGKNLLDTARISFEEPTQEYAVL